MTQQIRPARFSEIRIEGFRRLADIDLDLHPLCVLIGANGVGKTSFLDVFALLASSARGALNEKLIDFAGMASILTYGRADHVSLGLSMDVAGYAPLEYRLVLGPKGQSYAIAEEGLTQQRDPKPPPFKHIQSRGEDVRYFEVESHKLTRPTWNHNPLETSLAQVPKMFQEPEELRGTLASSTFYHVLDVGPRAPVRLPQPMRPAQLPGKDGEDLLSCLYYLRETDRSRFEAVEDTLRSAFPGFERLDFPPVAAGTLSMAWKDRAFSRPIYPHQLSEGTLRFLWLIALLQSPQLTAVTLLDEPEVSLHPELLSVLADLLREASQRTQIIVATHSDRLVRFLQTSEVVVMDLDEDGLTKMTWADQLDLDRWLDEYTLDEVWRMGRMGGRA